MTLLTKGEEKRSFYYYFLQHENICKMVRKAINNLLFRQGHFTWNLLENMTNRFLHIPDFAWISHALPLKDYHLSPPRLFTVKNIFYCFIKFLSPVK